jgi:transcriptional regulator with XRE-family HTH domain
MSDFSTELARRMRARAMGVRELSRRSGYSTGHISQLSRGQRNPSPEAARDLDDALGAGGALAAAVPAAGNSRAAGQASQGSEEVTDVLGRIQKLSRARADPEIIAALGADLRETVRQYETLDHDRLVPVLIRQRAWAETILGGCGHPGQRRQLFEAAATASGVLGYVAVGRGDFPLARAYCLEAFRLADFAQETGLQAWARGMQSFCEYYAGRYDDALSLAADGLACASGGPQGVRLAINGMARALGKLGDAEGVHRAVGEAMDLMDASDAPGGVPSSITLGCYSRAQTASNAATAYVSLGMPEQVQHYIGQAMPEISTSGSPWGRSLVMIDLAFSHIRSRDADLERATGLVLEALSISADRPVISVRQRAAEFIRDATATWGSNPRVCTVRDAAAALRER